LARFPTLASSSLATLRFRDVSESLLPAAAAGAAKTDTLDVVRCGGGA
jgi:hypothetical protein